MSARTEVWVKVRIESYEWMKVSAVTLAEAEQYLVELGMKVLESQYDTPGEMK